MENMILRVLDYGYKVIQIKKYEQRRIFDCITWPSMEPWHE